MSQTSTTSLTIPSLPFTQDGITYRVIQDDELEQAAEVVTRAFVNGNPLCVATKETYESMRPIMHSMLKEWIPEHLTIVAIHNNNNSSENNSDPDKLIRTHDGIMIGVASSSDAYQDPNEPVEPIIWPIPTLLHALEHPWYASHTDLQRGVACYLHFLAVLPSYRGHHVATGLCRSTYSIARTRGFRYVITQAAHVVTEKIWIRLGAHVVHRVDPATFAWMTPPKKDTNINTNTVATSTESNSTVVPSYPFASIQHSMSMCECRLLSDSELASKST